MSFHSFKRLTVVAILLAIPLQANAIARKGQRLPTFEATTVTGQKVSSSAYSGKVLLLAISSDNCTYCKTAIPHLNRMNAQYGAKGMQVQGLIYGPGFSRKGLGRYQEDNNVTFPLALSDNKTIHDTIGAFSTPTYLLVDKKGNVAGYFRGFSEANMEQIEQQAKFLLAQ